MRPTLKQSTYMSYESYIRVHLNPALGNIQLKELTPRILQQYYNYKAETEKLSPKTIVNLNLFLHKALSFAVAEGYINSNPADGVNLPRGSQAADRNIDKRRTGPPDAVQLSAPLRRVCPSRSFYRPAAWGIAWPALGGY